MEIKIQDLRQRIFCIVLELKFDIVSTDIGLCPIFNTAILYLTSIYVLLQAEVYLSPTSRGDVEAPQLQGRTLGLNR